MIDAYAIARYVRHYHAKNGYAPKANQLTCSLEEVAALERNGVIEMCPLFDGGPRILVCLTDKGMRMAINGRRKR